MLNNIILKFILVLFFNLTLALFADDESNNLENILEWEEVKFSKGYQVQIRNSNKKVLIDEKVNENKYKIKLPEGVYEERLGV